MTEDEKKKLQDSAYEELKDEYKAGQNDEWAADSQDELEDWIEEQGIQLRY